jgi:hypothetical protein
VRVRRAKALERLRSCCEPASRNLEAVRGDTLWEFPRTRTVSPSLHPRPASYGATDFLLASALSAHQQVLRPPGGEDARCVRPISATQTNCVHPHLSCSQLRSQLSLRGRPTETKAPRGSTEGPDVHDVRRPLRRIGIGRIPHARWLAPLPGDERGRFLPTAPMSTEPLTPLSRDSLHPHASHAFACAAS